MADHNIKYPVTPETLHKYSADLFTPVKRGECVSTIWVPMAGRRMWTKFLIENPELFEKELPNYTKYMMVYIEPLDLTEESLAGYLRLIGKSFLDRCRTMGDCYQKLGSDGELAIFDDETASYPRLLEALKKCFRKAADEGYEVLLFLGEFDELSFTSPIFYNNLRSLWGSLSSRLHYIFLMREDITDQEKITRWGDLTELVLQNVVYISLLNAKDASYVTEKISEELGVSLSEEEKTLLSQLFGGHPYMIRVGVRVVDKADGERHSLEDLKKLLLGYYELKSVARGVFDVQTAEAKEHLKSIADGQKVTDQPESIVFLRKMGLISKDNQGHTMVFGELFKQAILGTKNGGTKAIQAPSNGDLKVDEQTGAVVFNGRTVEEKFTRQEYLILSAFLQKTNTLFTRDDIGDILWGKQAYEKYSDWAIDQVISKLRKKLEILGSKGNLLTVKGKGYKFVTSS
ncbi:MAG: hypothetical protein UW69_C0015G0025 [Microgenomates group bacterium GW2011_GWA2_44_7]|nr:MAG: hypothetical protein UW69_C0015G0025 [Microgenomates group bacterium GW2011_GWA2_44_7]KKT77903.1 MAG: hypothetical protein UW73_C0009G0002 [Microgenomates group bacterium GW2011_GWB1_44_8]